MAPKPLKRKETTKQTDIPTPTGGPIKTKKPSI
jgi:hypothetical protein